MPGLIPRPRRRRLLWQREGRKCYWCGCDTVMVDNQQPNQATVDHIVPRYNGGLSTADNVVSACYRCNNRRNHEDFRGLEEGALLGVYKQAPNWKHTLDGLHSRHVALTRDEKKAIVGKVSNEQMLREDRDRLLAEVMKLREQIKAEQRDKKLIADCLFKMGDTQYELEYQMRHLTVWKLMRRRLAAWFGK